MEATVVSDGSIELTSRQIAGGTYLTAESHVRVTSIAKYLHDDPALRHDKQHIE